METLYVLSLISLSASAICSLIIIIDLLNGHKQPMWIMNVVWPVTALYAGPLALTAYYRLGRKSKAATAALSNKESHQMMDMQQKPFWQSAVTGTLHCGSGCTLGDIFAEALLIIYPVTLFGTRLYGGWLVDFIFAFFIGIVFQYYAIKPMKKISTGKAIVAALKADTASLIFWQIGMYGWMAISVFIIFHQKLEASNPVFWLMMQVGMLLGFATAFPVNWWLIRKGIKEAM